MNSFEYINQLAKKREPFLFVSDFLAKDVEVYPLSTLSEENISYSIKESKILKKSSIDSLLKTPLPFENYQDKFEKVLEHIKAGNCYLLNLTQPTKIKLNLSLQEIYNTTQAEYKLYYKDKFVCFSPEKFIQISNNTINTFPMKGTIDASLPNAKEKILSDSKEMAEHVMVVDLLRNDLSVVSTNVRVKEFRYITKLTTNEKDLLQVSSHICGDLEENWHEILGDILQSVLPAGSISGTPKKKTLEIIQEIEEYERGFFSGVFGVYDGENFDSGVMIRFIEKTDEGFIYKSGGGITLDSDVENEYNELLSKIYLP